ncbi:MAG TPA: glycosyltransferase [Planctomycetota bacterium]|nr:glycosyltransferase [Planctomycetota bacterium]
MSAPHPHVSAVIPVYNEEANLPELHERMTKALDSIGKSWELIYVDDGSADRSLELLTGYVAKDKRIKSVEFNRNYGQHAAVFAGLSQTRGDIVVTLDADLQNPPEEVPKLVTKMEEGYDVVGSVRKNRQDPFFRRIASRLVNRLTRSGNKAAHGMTDYGCMLRAYSRNVVDQICQCKELSSFIPVLAMLYAKKTTEVQVDHAERARGTSKYGLFQLLKLQMDLMTGFSFLPLRFLSLFGALIAGSAFALAVFILVMRIIRGDSYSQYGVFTLFAILFMMVGGLFIGMGILGEYVGRIYGEVRMRPRYVVRKVHGGDLEA